MAADGRLAEAEKLERETLETQRRVYGSENLTSIHFTMNYADIKASMGDDEESEKLLRQLLDLERRVLGPNQPETGETIYNLACLAAKHGRGDDAISLLREAVEIGLLPNVASAMEEDSDLKPLRGDPRFAALVARAKERAAAQNAN